MYRFVPLLFAVGCDLCGVLACAYKDDTAETGDDAVIPDYETDIQPIWNQYCVSCHGGDEPDEGLSLDLGPEELVSVRAQEAPWFSLVEPGNLGESYLWHKLLGSHETVYGRGDIMPPEGALPTGTILIIQDWMQGLDDSEAAE